MVSDAKQVSVVAPVVTGGGHNGLRAKPSVGFSGKLASWLFSQFVNFFEYLSIGAGLSRSFLG